MRNRTYIFQGIDWFLVGIYLLLVCFGWFNIYAAVYDEEHASIFDVSQEYGKQMMFISGALVLALIIMILDPNFYSAFAFPIYGIMVALLIAVYFGGEVIKGSRS